MNASGNVSGDGNGIDNGNGSNQLQLSTRWEASSRGGSPLSKYKGVVPHPNGRWGAQIYYKHQRVWLGTFNTEMGAAMAYDSAALLLGSRGSRNLPVNPLHLTLEERFQRRYSNVYVLSMIRDGSYPDRLSDFYKTWQSQPNNPRNGILCFGSRVFDVVCKEYFEKELVASDVGILSRLVIPKRFAIKFFPHVDMDKPDGPEVSQADLKFYDNTMKIWNFRYCFWKSGRTHVITRGWNTFVCEKRLKAKDVIVFFNCEAKPKQPAAQGGPILTNFSVIDYRRSTGPTEEDDKRVMGMEDGGRGKAVVDQAQPKGKEKGLRLFGVDIK